MGCNAWNHSSNCNCGWGGDTGGNGPGGSYRALQVVDGYTWRHDRKPTHDSFTIPNASCPVCGASVYFYQSPYGGRVFFDELGPPWPKHPCTDRGPAAVGSAPAHDYVFGPATTRQSKSSPLVARDAWRPLLPEEFTRVGGFDRIRLPKDERAPGKYVYVPIGWTGDAPSYWRWSPSDPAMIEVSCFRLVEDGSFLAEIFVLPSWLCNDEQFEVWRSHPDAALPPEALNAVGMSLSFAWRIPNVDNWYRVYPGVDLDAARSYFERAAASGYWAAINNLGVMYRDGIGLERDLAKAFELFERAAQSLNLTPLRHLTACYRDGIGCAPDSEHSAFLEELLKVREEEEQPAA